MFSKITSRFKQPPPSTSSLSEAAARSTARRNKENLFVVIPSILDYSKSILILIASSRPLYSYLLFMSLYYQVMGAVRCPKIEKHAGIRITPLNKAKPPYKPGDALMYHCETLELPHHLKCMDDGQWNERPTCPDPINNTCPDLGIIPHGTYNATEGPLKFNTVVAFKCQNELLPNLASVLESTTVTTATATTTTSATSPYNLSISSGAINNFTINSENSMPLRYSLSGHRFLKCLASSKWNHPTPTCKPIYSEPPSNVSFVLTSVLVILIPILILLAIVQLFVRWRKRQQQRARWKQYFTDYKYRHSKTSIAFGMRPQSSTANTVPVTDL